MLLGTGRALSSLTLSRWLVLPCPPLQQAWGSLALLSAVGRGHSLTPGCKRSEVWVLFPAESLPLQTCQERALFSISSYNRSVIPAFSLDIINKDRVFYTSNQLYSWPTVVFGQTGGRYLKAVIHLFLFTEHEASFRTHLKWTGGILLISLGFGSEVVEPETWCELRNKSLIL